MYEPKLSPRVTEAYVERVYRRCIIVGLYYLMFIVTGLITMPKEVKTNCKKDIMELIDQLNEINRSVIVKE
jgi:hypothetical protein